MSYSRQKEARGPCLYCDDDEPDVMFSAREHVIPQAFGTFEPRSLVLHNVCDRCNQAMGDELDIVLARGSLEGLLRFEMGFTAPNKYKGVGRRTGYVRRALEGPLKGMRLAPRVSPDKGELSNEPIRQVGFASGDGSEPLFFHLDEIPTRERLGQLLGSGPFRVVGMGFTSGEELQAFLRAHAFETTDGEFVADHTVLTQDRTVRIETVFHIDRTLFRAFAKIAYGYLAATHPEIARMTTFRAIRSFIRYDHEPGFPVLSFKPAPIRVNRLGATPEGHILMLRFQQQRNEMLAYVTLFNRVHYRVCLATHAFVTAVPPDAFTQAHFFNPRTRKMHAFGTD